MKVSMTSPLNQALKQFEATEANVEKLQRLWAKMERLLPGGSTISFDQEEIAQYEECSRSFDMIAAALPKIDGHKLTISHLPLQEVFQTALDCLELGEISATISAEEAARKQGRDLSEYKFRLRRAKKALARTTVQQLSKDVDSLIPILASEYPESRGGKAEGPSWNRLKTILQSIAALIAGAVTKPPRWNELWRHISWAEANDVRDIIAMDWPAVSGGLEAALCDEDEPVPVEVDDLGTLASSNPQGPIATSLHWDRLAPDAFERLLYNLVSAATGYDNPEWLTRTNAPDRGRDISVYRTSKDVLGGTTRSRVFIACKHYQSTSVSLSDVTLLREQTALWTDPRVDVLVIATSGRFTTDAVQRIEAFNADHSSRLKIEMWPDSTLERLLAERPGLIAEFHLR